MAPVPRLYRWSRLLRRLGTVAAVVIVLYIALTIYSASQLRIDSNGNAAPRVAGNVVSVTGQLDLANHGVLAVTGVAVSSVVQFPDGTMLGIAHSPVVTIAPGTNVSIPVTVEVPLTANPEAQLLLTHSVELPANTTATVTFGHIVTLTVVDSSGFSWGAPFDSLNITPGTPAPQGNGTVELPILLTFSNQANFDENGQLVYAVLSAGGATCATGTLSVGVPAGGGFSQTVIAYPPASCPVSGGSIALTYQGNGLNVTLPSEALP